MIKNKIIYKKIGKLILVLAILIFVFTDNVFALRNPSAVYCQKLGYEIFLEETEIGQVGTCKFSETESCLAWDFLIGKCGEEYGYCQKKGYQQKTIQHTEKCSSVPFSIECAVCVLETGEEVEVTKLMGLSFEEGICGDDVCNIGENYSVCEKDCPSGSEDFYCDAILDDICDLDCEPEDDLDCPQKLVCGDGFCKKNENYKICPLDCSSGSADNYCDGLKDGICDPDCETEQDPDCQKEIGNYLLYIIILFIIIILIVILVVLIKKRRKKYQTDNIKF